MNNEYERNKKLSEAGIVAGVLIALFVIGAIIYFVVNLPPREPRPTHARKPIDWEKAGEGLGDRATRFGHGVITGAKKASKDMKERDRDKD